MSERTGVVETYDPSIDGLVVKKVSALIRDGVTVDETVQIAFLNHRGFQSLFHVIGASRADVVQSGLMRSPALSLSVRFPEGGGRSSFNLGLAQEIVDLWQIPVRKKIAEAELEQTISAVLQRGIELAAEVQTGAYRLLGLRLAEQIAQENLELAEQSLKVAQARLDAGDVGPIDVNLVRSHVYEIQQGIISVRRDRRLAEVSLARSMGLVLWPTTWELIGSIDEGGRPPSAVDELLTFAYDERFDVKRARQFADAAEGQLEREWLDVFPSIQVGPQFERNDRRALPGRTILADTARASVAAGAPTAPTIESRGQRNLVRRQFIDTLLGPSIQITLPLWDQNQAQIERSRRLVLQRRKELDDLREATGLEVQQAWISATAAADLVAFFRDKSLPQASNNLETVRQQYEVGDQSVIILIEAQEFLIQQRRYFVDAQRDLAVAMTGLRRAVGGKMPLLTTSQPAHEPVEGSHHAN
ncbi:MAG: TolC family protein [Planctomycetota bacterium]